MDVALSRNGRIALRALFVLVVLFLYLPIAILLIFSFNNSELPSFPLSGFTLHWYHQFLTNADLRGALQTSAIIAARRPRSACACRHRSLWERFPVRRRRKQLQSSKLRDPDSRSGARIRGKASGDFARTWCAFYLLSTLRARCSAQTMDQTGFSTRCRKSRVRSCFGALSIC